MKPLPARHVLTTYAPATAREPSKSKRTTSRTTPRAPQETQTIAREGQGNGPVRPTPIRATGAVSNFRWTVETEASRETIWRLWTTPETWGSWDGGLRSARVDGPFALDAVGAIQPLRGPESRFRVTEYAEGECYAFQTVLPLGSLTVRRSFEPSEATTFTHEVRFRGALGWFWANMLGRGFGKELPATMERLARLAETEVNS